MGGSSVKGQDISEIPGYQTVDVSAKQEERTSSCSLLRRIFRLGGRSDDVKVELDAGATLIDTPYVDIPSEHPKISDKFCSFVSRCSLKFLMIAACVMLTVLPPLVMWSIYQFCRETPGRSIRARISHPDPDILAVPLVLTLVWLMLLPVFYGIYKSLQLGPFDKNNNYEAI